MKISRHFTLEEFSTTDHKDLLDENRYIAQRFIEPLTALAAHMDIIQDNIWGRININSGFRSVPLNAKIGGSPKSQHMKGEACDFDPIDMTTVHFDDFFLEVLKVIRTTRIPFGQLIKEGSGGKHWAHFSLGPGYRDPQRCGEVLEYKDGKYSVLDKLDVKSFAPIKPLESY